MLELENNKKQFKYNLEKFVHIIDLDESAPRPFIINNIINMTPAELKQKMQFKKIHIVVCVQSVTYKKEKKNISIYPKIQAN